MKTLYLEDLEGYTEKEILRHFITEYEAAEEQVNKFKVIVAYESVGDWGCDSSSYFLLKHKKDKKYYEVRGSHCSCYGFEGQFEPEEASLDYLTSDKFYFYTGGYDSNSEENKETVVKFMKGLRK